MTPCQSSTMFTHRSASILRKNPLFIYFPIRNSTKLRCILDQVVPKFTVSSSLSSVLTSGNAIAAAAAAGSGTVHGAVTSAITQVAVTAVAIASGACLSTKVDFLWPKVDEQPGQLFLFYSLFPPSVVLFRMFITLEEKKTFVLNPRIR